MRRYYKIKITQALCLYKICYTICQLGRGKYTWCNCKITILTACFVLPPCVPAKLWCLLLLIFFAVSSFLKWKKKVVCLLGFFSSLSISTKFNLQLHKGNYCSLGSQTFQQIPRTVQRKEWFFSPELWIKRIIQHRLLSESSNLIENVDIHAKNVSEVKDSI